MTMHITVCFPPGKDGPRWVDALRLAAPANSCITLWPELGVTPADYAIVWRPTQAFFDSQSNLKVVFNAGAGVDAVLALKLPAVPLVRLNDAGMGVQMAQYVVHAVLRHFRQFDTYSAQARSGQWLAHEPKSAHDFPIGIMGYGVLGKQIATALQTLGFNVHCWTRSEHESVDVKNYSGDARLRPFLAATRILVCVLPMTAQTRCIIRHETLAQLMPNAYLINIARGGHVNEADLICALDAGSLAGASLDVCEHEPAGAEHPFWSHPKIELTPHIAASTLRDESIAQILSNIKAHQRGENMVGVVKLDEGY